MRPGIVATFLNYEKLSFKHYNDESQILFSQDPTSPELAVNMKRSLQAEVKAKPPAQADQLVQAISLPLIPNI